MSSSKTHNSKNSSKSEDRLSDSEEEASREEDIKVRKDDKQKEKDSNSDKVRDSSDRSKVKDSQSDSKVDQRQDSEDSPDTAEDTTSSEQTPPVEEDPQRDSSKDAALPPKPWKQSTDQRRKHRRKVEADGGHRPSDCRTSGRQSESRDSTDSRTSRRSTDSHGVKLRRPPSAGRQPKRPATRRHSNPEKMSGRGSTSKGRKVRFTEDTKPSSAGSLNRPPHYHVVILCSSDKVFEMKNLMENLQETGYDTKVISVSEQKLLSCRPDVVVAAVSLRFAKDTNLYKTGRPILPIQLDSITFPPHNLDNLPRRLNPIDCTNMENRSEWQQTPELNEVIDRLETLIPTVRAIRGIKRERSSSQIPLAKGHHAKPTKPPPLDPLAREASEITIRVKPPTPPRWKKSSSIPVKARQSKDRDRDQEYEYRNDDDIIQDGDGEDLLPDEESTESEPDSEEDHDDNDSEDDYRDAKDMQNGYKLPQIQKSSNQPAKGHSNRSSAGRDSNKRDQGSRQPPASNNGFSRSTSYNPKGDRDRDQRRRTSSTDKNNNQADNSQFDWDRKLPSVYRKRQALTMH